MTAIGQLLREADDDSEINTKLYLYLLIVIHSLLYVHRVLCTSVLHCKTTWCRN